MPRGCLTSMALLNSAWLFNAHATHRLHNDTRPFPAFPPLPSLSACCIPQVAVPLPNSFPLIARNVALPRVGDAARGAARQHLTPRRIPSAIPRPTPRQHKTTTPPRSCRPFGRLTRPALALLNAVPAAPPLLLPRYLHHHAGANAAPRPTPPPRSHATRTHRILLPALLLRRRRHGIVAARLHAAGKGLQTPRWHPPPLLYPLSPFASHARAR